MNNIRTTYQKLSDGSQEVGFYVGHDLLGVLSKPAIGRRNWFWHSINKPARKFATRREAIGFIWDEIEGDLK